MFVSLFCMFCFYCVFCVCVFSLPMYIVVYFLFVYNFTHTATEVKPNYSFKKVIIYPGT
jgi:uncharacterized membrane protein